MTSNRGSTAVNPHMKHLPWIINDNIANNDDDYDDADDDKNVNDNVLSQCITCYVCNNSKYKAAL